jgi:hypothetical protein
MNYLQNNDQFFNENFFLNLNDLKKNKNDDLKKQGFSFLSKRRSRSGI